MDGFSKRVFTTASGAGLASIVLAAFGFAQIQKLSLPFPAAIAILNILIPACALIGFFVSRRSAPLKDNAFSRILAALASASTLLPIILLTLSVVYGLPSEILSCMTGLQWQRLYHNKNSAAIRAIQDRLHCCGFNSLHDRPWPFPSSSHGIDDRTCERTLNYTRACAGVLQRQESTTAAMVGLASFINWVLLVWMLSSRQETQFQRRERRWLIGRNPIPSSNVNVAETAYEDEPSRA